MTKIQLVEKHQINKASPIWKQIDSLSFLSKNLYNAANYICRQEFFAGNYIPSYIDLQRHLQNNSEDYRKLPAKISQQVIKVLDKNWKSYFHAIVEYRKNPEKFLGEPHIPKYKDKEKGRNLLVYTIQAISRKHLKSGFVNPSGTNIFIKTNVDTKAINQVRIVPQSNCYIIEVVYTQGLNNPKVKKSKNIASIDVGLDNLAALVSNANLKPILYSGKPLKAVNQLFNKKKAKLHSLLPKKQKTSKKIKSLTLRRNNKVSDYLHKTSRMLINQLVSHNIDTLVIGKNDNWKQDISLGKKNNQSFVQIPHARFIQMLEYKAKLEGIKVIKTEESYTSKTSFLDKEKPCKHTKYKGKRIFRGLFQSKDGINISSDANSAFQIMKKVFPNAFKKAHGIEAFVVSPVRINPYKQ